jgi:hypothetical protein
MRWASLHINQEEASDFSTRTMDGLAGAEKIEQARLTTSDLMSIGSSSGSADFVFRNATGNATLKLGKHLIDIRIAI